MPFMYTNTHTHMHTHAHMHTHIHTHTLTHRAERRNDWPANPIVFRRNGSMFNPALSVPTRTIIYSMYLFCTTCLCSPGYCCSVVYGQLFRLFLSMWLYLHCIKSYFLNCDDMYKVRTTNTTSWISYMLRSTSVVTDWCCHSNCYQKEVV